MAQPNGLNPSFTRVVLPGNVQILTGPSTTHATILDELGQPVTTSSKSTGPQQGGSIYISTATATPTLWVLVGNFWTQLTIN